MLEVSLLCSCVSCWSDPRDAGFSYEMLHGGNSTAERQSSVDSFQSGEAFVFLIST